MRINPMKENPTQIALLTKYENKKNYIGKISLHRSVEVNRMKRYSIIMVALLTLTMIGTMLTIIPESAEASPITVVTVALDPTPPRVDVSPGASGIVTITGSVQCEKYGPDQVKVSLYSSSDTGSASVMPSMLVFSQSGEQSIGVTTRVPQGYTFSATPSVTVSGNFVQGGLQYPTNAATQLVEIEPYYKLEVDTPPPAEIGPGEFVYFPIKITNVGNAEDTYRFEFLNLEDLNDDQWTIATITDKTFVEDEFKTITVSAQAPQTWTIWRNDVTPLMLRITSIQSEQTAYVVKYDVPLYVRQKGIYIPGFSPVFAIIGIGAVALVMGKRRISSE